MVGSIRRVEEPSDVRFLKAELAARFAVEKHNNKALGEKEFLQFRKIVNLNVEPTAGRLFYITMLLSEADGELRLYQLKIWEKLNSANE